MDILSDLRPTSVILEGQEASLDPSFSLITETLHERFNTQNILLTNGLNMPDLSHVDKVAVGLKCFDEACTSIIPAFPIGRSFPISGGSMHLE